MDRSRGTCGQNQTLSARGGCSDGWLKSAEREGADPPSLQLIDARDLLQETLMSDPAEFLSLAHQCFQFADHAESPEQRTSLLTMAQAWLDLAAEEEYITKLVREADMAFEIRAA